MAAHETMLPRKTPTPQEAESRKTSVRLPPELLKKARSRVAFIAHLMVWLCLIAYLIELTIGSSSLELLIVYSVVLVSSVLLFAAGRIQRFGHGLVLRLGLAYEIVVCSAVSLGFTWIHYKDLGEAPFVTWTSLWIVVFPLIIPSRPATTLLVAFLAALTAPLAIMVLWAMGSVVPVGDDFITACITPAMCIIIAVASSKVIFGMSLDVARARELGSYRLIEALGQGGMGEVWRAEHKMLARPAAIKLISTRAMSGGDSDSADSLTKRFEREAQATATLESAHTVDIYDFGATEDGAFYYVMELLNGLDLDEAVKRFGPLPPERVVHILGQVCHSLAEAHQEGLIHRDIKPANIFLCKKGLDYDFVKVLDFGLVKSVFQEPTRSQELTMDGNITGTPAFLAPEIALGRKATDGRADLYALGCVGYWLLTGKLVFEEETPMATIMEHVKTEPPRLSTRTEIQVPRELENAVHACLSKDPAERPRDALQLAQLLAQVPCESPWTQPRAKRWWELHLHRQG